MLRLFLLGYHLYQIWALKFVFKLIVRVGGWLGGWLEKLKIRLNSASVEVEVEAELGKSNAYAKAIWFTRY